MSLGFGQILIIILLLFLLFGNIPNLFKDLGIGVKYLQGILSKEEKVDKLSSENSKKNESS
jgi:Sec-independent protein translocase protein TatA